MLSKCRLVTEFAPPRGAAVKISLRSFRRLFLNARTESQDKLKMASIPASSSFSSSTSSSQPKPPNILIYQSDKDVSHPAFLRARESLESCLTPERCVIYPLGADDITHYSPWRENCRLLVLPSLPAGDSTPTMPPRLMEEVVSYAEAGGHVLSMWAGLNRHLGLGSVREALRALTSEGCSEESLLSTYCPDSVCDVEVAPGRMESEQGCKFSCLVPKLENPGESLNLSLKKLILTSTDEANLVPVEWNADMEWIRNANQCNNKDQSSADGLPNSSPQGSHDLPSIPCVRTLSLTNGGHAVLSSVDLFPALTSDLEVSPLLRLKKGVAQCGRFLMYLLRILGLECSEDQLPELTHTYLLCNEENRSLFLSAIKPHLRADSTLPGKDLSLRFLTHNYAQGTPVDSTPLPSLSELTVVTRPAPWQLKELPFSQEEYFQQLRTRELGRTLLHTPVITSTQLPFTGNLSFCQALQSSAGLVWVAAQQTRGKGRSGNAWISPQGSMMFSTILHFPPKSRLSHHLPLLQHIVAVAVVHGVRSLPGYQQLPLRIKWPNDIYYKSQVKLGGILVSCMSVGNSGTHAAIIGCGVNVSNRHPTMSVNDAISLHNLATGEQLPPISVETALASTLSTLEALLTAYEVRGVEELLALYYKYWLHSDATVFLASHGEEKVKVQGLDKYGYLLVRREDGEQLSLQPDGNSFDIMKGLIVMKT